jgi:2-dehydro-3-deoxygluconokinase
VTGRVTGRVAGRVVTFGEALDVQGIRAGTGGAEANLAIGVARLGAAVTWLGRVGDDEAGRRIARTLRGEGVDARVIVDPDAPTGMLRKTSPAPGRTEIEYHRAGSAGSRIAPDDLEGLRLGPADILHLTGVTPALSPSARAAVMHAIGLAESAGTTISYDVNHRTRLWSAGDALPVHRAIAARARVLFAGLDEARLLVGDAEDPLEALAALGPAEVILKRGTSPALALIDGERHAQPAMQVDVVDTVGAGDAFAAGYLAERLAGLGAEGRLATAVRTGALACTHAGDWEGAPTRAQLSGFVGRPHADAGADDGADPVIR